MSSGTQLWCATIQPLLIPFISVALTLTLNNMSWSVPEVRPILRVEGVFIVANVTNFAYLHSAPAGSKDRGANFTIT